MSLSGEKSLPSLPIDMDPSRSLTPAMDGADVTTPKSAIIALPPDWSTENSPGNSTNISRSSFEGHPPASFPLSASSSSSSSNPIFSWPTSSFNASSSRSGPSHRPMRERTDPFDRSSPFDFDERRKSGSSSEEELLDGGLPAFLAESADIARAGPVSGVGSAEDIRRGSVVMIPHHMRALTDPDLVHGLPVDSEITGAVPHDDFDFSPVGNGDGGAGTQGLTPPTFNRTFSAPLPNRVGFLRHPLSPSEDPLGCHSAHPPRQAPTSTSFSALGGPPMRTPTSYIPPTPPTPGISRSDSSTAPSETLETPMQTLSMELADSLQSAIQTLLHLSPPHLLDNAKEQYSGCTVQMPTTSLSALLTSMRSLNYFSANIHNIVNADNKQVSSNPADSGLLAAAANRKREDFDIGELLQNVADLMSGQASQAGVDLVLFHGDVGMKHISVNGDVEGLGYLLGHILRQILLVAERRDTIELGLQIIPQSPSMTPRVSLPLSAADIDRSRKREASASTLRSSSPGKTLPTPPSGSSDGPVLCTFEIIHNIFQPLDPTTTPKAEMNPFTHLDEENRFAKPKFDTIVCRRLLQHQNASLRVDTQPSSPLGNGLLRRAYELTVLLPRGDPLVEPTPLTHEEEAVRQPFTHVKLAREPTLEELSQFADSLRGKKVVLHASLSSLFARHLTSYLGAWGMDISHVPVEEEEAVTERPMVARSSTSVDTDVSTAMASMSLDTTGDNNATASRFIIIDDDVDVLKRELLRIRTDMSLTLKPRLSKRPTLLSRARSSPLVRQTPIQPPPSNLVVIHFTSLANYNHVRDVVATHLGTAPYYGSGSFGYPEVMVIPKPVGPRRFLTALHTAVNQPVVDPSFSPIATSPRSPGGGHFLGSARTPSESGREGFFDTIPEGGSDGEGGPLRVPSDGGSQKARSPLGEYPPTTGASIVRTDRGLHIALPTPGEIMSTPAAEYFSNAGMRTGSAGGSAVVMQSPDGRPFGMFFEPPVKSERRTVSGSRPSSGARKIPNRKTSNVPDKETPEAGSGSQVPSPAGSRRHSTLSNNADHSGGSSRRGSANELRIVSGGSADEAPQLTRKMTRKESSPASTAEPILAKGRARSGTVTREATLKRRQAGATGGLSPSTENVPKPARAAKKKEEDMVVPPINVLIVEDNPINQNILSMFLKKKKIKHQTAKDGLEAVEKWKTGGFHLILMDIQLPVMDGIEATKEIRRQEQSNNIGVFPQTPASEPSRTLAVTPTGEIPPTPLKSKVIIVALTASSLHSDRLRALGAGCNDFLTKPVSLKWLEKKIIEWGCMQALIDFEGWRRWKSSDPRDPAGETKRAFSTAPQAAAKSLAGRLKINPDRKSLRQSSVSSSGSATIMPHEPSPAKSTSKTTSSSPLSSQFSQNTPSTGQPEITLQAATPDPYDQPTQPVLAGAAEELEKARSDLNDSANVVIRDPDEACSNPPIKPGESIEGDSAIGMGVGPPPDLTSRGSGGSVGASVEPDLNSIEEDMGEGGEKPLPLLPKE